MSLFRQILVKNRLLMEVKLLLVILCIVEGFVAAFNLVKKLLIVVKMFDV